MRVSVVVSGLGNSTQRLQPWRYLTEMAMGLAALGHEIEILTDGPTELELTGVRLWSARSERAGASNLRVNDRLRTNRPDIVLWNCGTTSALRAGPLRLPGTRNVAVFTSPLHEPAELARLGRAVIRQPSSYLALGLGSLIPRRYLARWLAASFDQIVFLGASTAAQLAVAGLPAGRSVVIPPGRDVDLQPAEPLTVDRVGLRGRVSFVFAGSPAPIRGADLLVRAFAGARTHAPHARLVILARHERSALAAQTGQLIRLAGELGIRDTTEFVEGNLPRSDFLDRLMGADVLVLPFRLVPSEAPMAVLEAAGSGLPLLTSDLVTIRDLAAPGTTYVEPGSTAALAEAIVQLASDPDRRLASAELARAWYGAWPTWAQASGRLAESIGLTGPSTTVELCDPAARGGHPPMKTVA